MSDEVSKVVDSAKATVEADVKVERNKVVAFFVSHPVATAVGSAVLGAVVGHLV